MTGSLQATTPYTTDYCDDDYSGWWWDKTLDDGDGAWDEAETDNCQYVISTPDYYAYYVGEDTELTAPISDMSEDEATITVIAN